MCKVTTWARLGNRGASIELACAMSVRRSGFVAMGGRLPEPARANQVVRRGVGFVSQNQIVAASCFRNDTYRRHILVRFSLDGGCRRRCVVRSPISRPPVGRCGGVGDPRRTRTRTQAVYRCRTLADGLLTLGAGLPTPPVARPQVSRISVGGTASGFNRPGRLAERLLMLAEGLLMLGAVLPTPHNVRRNIPDPGGS